MFHKKVTQLIPEGEVSVRRWCLLVPTSQVINLSLFSIKIYFILIKQLSFCLCNLQMPIFIAIPAVKNYASLSWSMIFQLIKLLCSLIAKLAHSPPQLKRLWVVTEILNLTFSIILTSWSRALYFELLIMIHPLVPIYIQLVIQI